MSLTESDNDRTLKNKISADKASATPPQPRRRRKKSSETSWWVGGFLFGFVIGLVMSLTYGWLINPRPLPITPAELNPAGKAYYITMVAGAYLYDYDDERAKSRLSALDEPDIAVRIIDVAEQTIQAEGDIRDIEALVALADLYGEVSPLMAIYMSTPTMTPTPMPTATPTETAIPSATATATPTASKATATAIPTLTRTPIPITFDSTSEPITNTNSLSSSILSDEPTSVAVKPTITRRPPRTPTATRRPTRTPTATSTPTSTPDPNAPYYVEVSELVCDRRFEGLLRVYVRDRLGSGLLGTGVTISWPDGQDRFYTGIKQTNDPGYADFKIEFNRPYQVDLLTLEVVEPLPEIMVEETQCRGMNPSWRLVFQQGVQ